MQQQSSDLNVFNNFNKGKFFRNTELFSNILHAIQAILHHEDSGVSNPVGDKIKKFETYAFHFILWNIHQH